MFLHNVYFWLHEGLSDSDRQAFEQGLDLLLSIDTIDRVYRGVPASTDRPLIVSGGDPLIVANLLFFLAFPACGLAFFLAAWRLTLDVRAAVVAGVAGAWYPFHCEHYSHLGLQWFMVVPLAL